MMRARGATNQPGIGIDEETQETAETRKRRGTRRCIIHPMSLDEDFPLGDGTADVEAVVTCPYCGEPGMLTLDPGSGDAQNYVEDCPVCCRPWQVFVRYSADGAADVRIDRL